MSELPDSLQKAFEFIQELNQARSYPLLDIRKGVSLVFHATGKAASVAYWEYRSPLTGHVSEEEDMKMPVTTGAKRRYLFVDGKPSKPFFDSLKIQNDHILMISDPWVGKRPTGCIEFFKRTECIPGLHRHAYQPRYIHRIPPLKADDPRISRVQTIDQSDIWVRFYGFVDGQFFEVTESHHLTACQTTIYKVVACQT